MEQQYERFVGSWDSKFDIVPDLTEEEKEAIYGLLELSKTNNQEEKWRNEEIEHI